MTQSCMPAAHPTLSLTGRTHYTACVPAAITLDLSLPRRTPHADITLELPRDVSFKDSAVLVNVAGRGDTPLLQLSQQSPGRCGIGYERAVGQGKIHQTPSHTLLCIHDLDLRPDNGIDVHLVIQDAVFDQPGEYAVSVCARCEYDGQSVELKQHTTLFCSSTLSDLRRDFPFIPVHSDDAGRDIRLLWSQAPGAQSITLFCSQDAGETFAPLMTLPGTQTQAVVRNLSEGRVYAFRLEVLGGCAQGISNTISVWAGVCNVRTQFGAPIDGSDAAPAINKAIEALNRLGGGTLLFEGGCFSTTTIFLQSNVHLYIDQTAVIRALPGCCDEEAAFYSDEEYRRDDSHMSRGPYLSPDNFMTKQDFGHSHWQNALFVGIRADNVKIIGNGRIDGALNLTKLNTIPCHPHGQRADKAISLKLCTRVEIGGLSVGRDLWYEETEDPNHDQPFYPGSEERGIGNMLRVSNCGHFVVLATGTDMISIHDLYAEKGEQVRDIIDLMACNDTMTFNIYAEGAADDVVKLGSDCSLGFTRPARNAIVRSIIGDSCCNLFQIGSETADDIENVCVDQLYVLGSNKAGFSISVNDGGFVRDIHLNCGGSVAQCRCGNTHRGLSIGYTPERALAHRSIMRRIRTPLFISLSARSRTLGAQAVSKSFIDDAGVYREELLVANVHLGKIENLYLGHFDADEIYAASQAKSGAPTRWPVYAGQPRTTAMIVGYKIPDDAKMTLPDGSIVGHIQNVTLEDIRMTVKGGNPAEDARSIPRELGVGQFNLRNLAGDDRGSGIPAHGLYIRHVRHLAIRNLHITAESHDGRPPVVLEDTKDVRMDGASPKVTLR